MPMMLPPGQGVTVSLPNPGQPAVTSAPASPGPPPTPFRRVKGPDLTIIPHAEPTKQEKSAPPA